jgi:membrane associated rhomboid family serine protease
MALLILLVVVGVLAYRGMTTEERVRFARATLPKLQSVMQTITLRHREPTSFHDALHLRTPLAPVTPTLLAVNTVIFVFTLWGTPPLGDAMTLVEWGGNFGPRTANGEWWRVMTALFIHANWFHLLADGIGVAQLGLILERLVGPLAFTAVYLAAGLIAGVVHLSVAPVAVDVGASGAIFGAYGLMCAVLVCGVVRGSTPILPWLAAKQLLPTAVVFVFYSLSTDAVATVAELAGFVTGFSCGLILAWRSGEGKAPVTRIALIAAGVFAVAVVSAAPLRGMHDVSAELERVVGIEERIAATFQRAVDQFRNGGITADALADVIDGDIMPDVKAARARFDSLDNVVPEQQKLLVAGKEYLRLRDESWRVRARAIRDGSMRGLSEADAIATKSLESLNQITEPVVTR